MKMQNEFEKQYVQELKDEIAKLEGIRDKASGEARDVRQDLANIREAIDGLKRDRTKEMARMQKEAAELLKVAAKKSKELIEKAGISVEALKKKEAFLNTKEEHLHELQDYFDKEDILLQSKKDEIDGMHAETADLIERQKIATEKAEDKEKKATSTKGLADKIKAKAQKESDEGYRQIQNIRTKLKDDEKQIYKENIILEQQKVVIDLRSDDLKKQEEKIKSDFAALLSAQNFIQNS